ncbi:hypothetical protein BpHYR1_025691 [Brachionus plicatilis]|uniref:Uncharacterized protein n=1 Tax=Brachionus plicatilis TaxID=10195 RepID=A0A3M7SH16_BRAPC|nr:hypothetical protein BpHYR1_025691 [Brachionus plicatilis]
MINRFGYTKLNNFPLPEIKFMQKISKIFSMIERLLIKLYVFFINERSYMFKFLFSLKPPYFTANSCD